MAKPRIRFTMTRLNRAIIRAQRTSGMQMGEIIDQAGTFFAQSAIKAMPPRRRQLRRKVYEYTGGTTRTRFAFWVKRGFPIFFRRRSDAVRDSKMRYRYLGKWAIFAAATSARVRGVASPPDSERAPAKARELGYGRRQGFRIGRPRITLDIYARDVAGPAGRKALNEGQHRASGRLHGYLRNLKRQQAREFQRA